MREAASSIANGIPSRRPQISTTALASAPASEIPGATAAARCRNRVAAAESTPASTSSEGTGHSCSSATRKPSRLVARIFTVAERARIASIRSAAASRTCSQLSNTNSRDPALQRGRHTAGNTHTRLLGDAEHGRHRVGHRRRVGDRGQFEKPDTVRELIGQARRDFERQAGLADPADTGQCHQPMCADRLLHLDELGLPPDEAGGLGAQVPRCRIQRREGRKVATQADGAGLGTSQPVWQCPVIAVAPKQSGRCCCTARQCCRPAEPARHDPTPSPAPHD